MIRRFNVIWMNKERLAVKIDATKMNTSEVRLWKRFNFREIIKTCKITYHASKLFSNVLLLN